LELCSLRTELPIMCNKRLTSRGYEECILLFVPGGYVIVSIFKRVFPKESTAQGLAAVTIAGQRCFYC
jgi:hypothetical protein